MYGGVVGMAGSELNLGVALSPSVLSNLKDEYSGTLASMVKVRALPRRWCRAVSLRF